MIPRNSVMRVARPTDHLQEITMMYQLGLGFEIIGSFRDHKGFDGFILGHPNHSYHLEFTHHRGHTVGVAPSQDNLIVFYLPDKSDWDISRETMLKAGFVEVDSYNPYWDQSGCSFEDLDGYRIVLQNTKWQS